MTHSTWNHRARPAEIFLLVLRRDLQSRSYLTGKILGYRLAQRAQAICMEPSDLLKPDGPDALGAIALTVCVTSEALPDHITLNASWRLLLEQIGVK